MRNLVVKEELRLLNCMLMCVGLSLGTHAQLVLLGI